MKLSSCQFECGGTERTLGARKRTEATLKFYIIVLKLLYAPKF